MSRHRVPNRRHRSGKSARIELILWRTATSVLIFGQDSPGNHSAYGKDPSGFSGEPPRSPRGPIPGPCTIAGSNGTQWPSDADDALTTLPLFLSWSSADAEVEKTTLRDPGRVSSEVGAGDQCEEKRTASTGNITYAIQLTSANMSLWMFCHS